MNTPPLTPNTKAILLLYSTLGEPNNVEPKPLTQAEYHKFACWLHRHRMQPCDLLTEDGRWVVSELDGCPIKYRRLFGLLNRDATLAIVVKEWTKQGIWVISRGDEAYPRRFKVRLKQAAPAIFYGVGNQRLLNGDGLVIVGARNVDDVGRAFTRSVAQRCVQEHIPVISGGARGVDSTAMHSALQKGGQVIGILAHALAHTARSTPYCASLQRGSLVLLSATLPNASFHAHHALARNKYLYALGEWGLAVGATKGKGGTWAGATYNLNRKLIPLFVHTPTQPATGSQALIEHGGIPFDESILENEVSVRDWFIEQSPRAKSLTRRARQLSLLDWGQRKT